MQQTVGDAAENTSLEENRYREEPPAPPDGGVKPRDKSIWHNRDFVLLWSGQVTSILGGKLSELAYPLVVLALTKSPAKAGLVPIFWMAPFIAFGLPAGALVDRWNRKTVMLVCDTVRMLGVAMLPIAYLMGHLNVALVYTAALIEGFGFCFFNLAEVAAIPQVVEKRHLPHAMAVNEMGYSATNTVGPGIAGAVIASMRTTVAGTALAFAVDSVSYLASLLGLSLMKTPFQQERGSDNEHLPIWDAIKEGLVFLWNQERVRTVWFWGGWISLVYGPFQLVIILMVRHLFHEGAQTIGMIFSVGGVGGIIGAMIAPKLKLRLRFGTALILVVVVQSVATIIQAFAPNLILLAAMEFFIALAGPLWNVTQMAYRLSIIPDKLQGRVNACYRMAVFSAFPLGSAAGGVMLEHISPRIMLGLMGTCGLLSVGVICMTKLRKA